MTEDYASGTRSQIRSNRAAHPDAPIVLVEDRTMQDLFLIAGRMEWYHLKNRTALKAGFDRPRKDGVKILIASKANIF